MLRFKASVVCVLLLMLIGASSCNEEDGPNIPQLGEDIYVADHSFKVVGYLPAWSLDWVDSIEFEKLTYVNIAFGNLNGDGDIYITTGVDIKSTVQKIRARAPQVQVMLSLAGGLVEPEFQNAWNHFLGDDDLRLQTVVMMKDYVLEYDLDGLDVDIEGGMINDLGVNYNKFVLALRQQLHAEGKAITAALPGHWLNPVIESSTLEAFDFINLMVYDATGPWNPNNIGPHSPFSLAEDAIDLWVHDLGIDPENLVLGMPYYGRDFDPTHELALKYGEIVRIDPEYAYQDEVDLLFYNGIPTIVEKTKLAMRELNGVMFWEVTQDSFDDLSLLRAVDQVVSASCPNLNDIGTYYLDSDGDGLGDLNHPVQDCVQPVGYVDNRDDCDDGDAQGGC